MNTLPLFVAALVLLPAIGVGIWAWWMMLRTEEALRIEARLDVADFDIGTWPGSTHTSAAWARLRARSAWV